MTSLRMRLYSLQQEKKSESYFFRKLIFHVFGEKDDYNIGQKDRGKKKKGWKRSMWKQLFCPEGCSVNAIVICVLNIL